MNQLQIILLGIFFGGFFLLPKLEFAQNIRTEVYQCYVYNQATKWRNQLKLDVSQLQSLDAKFDFIEAQYGYIGYCLTHDKSKEAEGYIYKTQKLLKQILKSQPQNARATALYGALLSMEIELFPAKSMFIGPKATSYIEKSKKLDSQEPVCWLEQGNFRFHAPSMFGGDKKRAAGAFQKAIHLFEAKPSRQKNNWMYLHALVWLAKSYQELGQKSQAIATYQKALAYEPDFSWVKDDLLPAALGK